MLGGDPSSSAVLYRVRLAAAMGELALGTMRADFDMSPRREVPVDRVAESEGMAGPGLVLCSSDASYVTGVTLPADGGQAAD